MRAATALVLVIGCVAVNAESSCAPSENDISCSACASGAGINALDGIPRVNRALQPIPSNLGEFEWFKCPTDGENQACGTDEACFQTCEIEDVSFDVGTPTPTSSPLAAVDNLIVYAGVAITFALLTACFSAAFCIGRCCCCCICKGGTCGKAYPTLRTKLLGFEARPPFHYRAAEVWGAQIVVWVFTALVVSFIIVGNVEGNQGFTSAQKSVVRAPAGLMRTVQDSVGPMESLVVNVADKVVVPGVQAMNATFTDAVDTEAVIGHLECVEDSVAASTPDLVVVRGVLNDSRDAISHTNDTIVALNTSLNAIDTNLAASRAAVAVVNTTLGHFDGNTSVIVGELDNTELRLNETETPYVTEWSGPEQGAAAMQANLTLLGNLPPTGDVTNSDTACTSPTADGASGSPTYISRAGELSDIQTSVSGFQASGDHGKLADALEAHNNRRNAFLGNDTAGSMIGAVDDLEAAMAAMPSFDELLRQVEELEVVLGSSLNGTGEAQDLIVQLNSSLVNFPSLLPIVDELNKVSGITVAVECAGDVVAELRRLNDSVIRLPDSLSDIEASLGSVNESASSVDGTVADLRQTSDDLAETTRNMTGNLNTAFNQLEDVQQQGSGNSSLDVDALRADLAAVNGSFGALNFTQLRSSLLDVNETLASPAAVADPALVTALRSLHSEVLELQAAEAAFRVWHETGTCTSDDSDCDPTVTASGTCGSCESGKSVCSAARGVACTSDSGCAVGQGSCLFQQSTINDGAVPGYGVIRGELSGPGVTALATQMGELSGALDSLPDLDEQRRDIGDARSDLQSFDFVDFQSQLGEMNDQLTVSGGDDDGSDIGSSLDDASAELSSFDLSSTEAELDDLDVQLADLNSTLTQAEDVKAGLQELNTFLYASRGVAEDLAQLTESSLRAVSAQSGTAGMLQFTAEVMQNITGKLDSVMQKLQGGGDSSLTGGTSLPDELESSGVLDTVRVIAGEKYSSGGAMHFFLALIQGEDSVLDVSAVQQGTLTYDASGAKYPGDKMCLTDACLDATIDEVNTQPLSESREAGELPVPVSRELIFLLPFLPIIIIVLFAVAGTVNCFGGKWQGIVSCTSSVMMSICAPLLFLFVGALFFPLGIVAHDVCRGGPNVAFTYVQGSQAALCVQFGGTPDLSSGMCVMDVPGTDNSTFELNIGQAAGAMLGDCAAAPGVFAGIWDSVDSAFATAPEEAINGTIEDSQGAEGEIRPQLAADLRGMARNSSKVMSTFIGDVSGLLGCKAVNDNGYAPLKDAMCCEMFDAYYWYVCSLYMCAFCMVFCGWWGGILGRKRFVEKPWGPEIEAAAKNFRLAQDRENTGMVEIELGSHVEGAPIASEWRVAASSSPQLDDTCNVDPIALPDKRDGALSGRAERVVQVTAAPVASTYTPSHSPAAASGPGASATSGAGSTLATSFSHENPIKAKAPSKTLV